MWSQLAMTTATTTALVVSIFNDPYGECNLVGGGYPKTGGTYGKNVKYSYKNWLPRWSVANDHDGWGLDIWK